MSLTAFLPQSEGLLPYFLLYTSFSAFAHSIVTYLNPLPSMISFRGPCAPPPSPLLAHVYGVKNIYTALLRLCAAYTLQRNAELYYLAMCTFVGVFFLYSTELAVFRTVRTREAAIPLVTSSAGMAWMWAQREFYLP